MKKPRKQITSLSSMIERIDNLDSEIEQVQRVLSRLMVDRERIDRDLKKAQKDTGIDLEDKPGRAGA
jgi:hypothetical protein